MVDPFSIIVGAAGLLDVCWRVGSYLKDVDKSAGKVEKEIAALSHEITSLISVNESIIQFKGKINEAVPGTSSDTKTEINTLWKLVDTNTKGCMATVVELEELLEEIIGKKGPKVADKVDGIMKSVRRQSKDVGLAQFHHRLSNYQANLNTLLAALNV